MLIELYGQNFGCFRDEFRLSMLATEIDPDSDRGIVEAKVEGDTEPLRLLRAVAIYGPNASGKSTILRAAHALSSLMSGASSFRSDELLTQYEPFGLKADAGASRLGAKVIIGGNVYDYEVQFLRSHFTSERLDLLHADGEKTELINRHGQNVTGQWVSNPLFVLISKDFRPNALLLSLADRLAPLLAKNIAVCLQRLLSHHQYSTFHNLPAFNNESAKRAWEDRDFADWLIGHLRSADVGVIDVKAEEFEMNLPRWGDQDDRDSGAAQEPEVQKYYKLRLRHGVTQGNFTVPYNRESQGTRRLVEIAPLLYDLARGSLPVAAFVDEMGDSMHPILLQAIIREFNGESPLANGGGQLIFTTHETALLDAEAKNAVLRRDQIYLTDKDETGAARLYSVEEFKERNNLNIRKRYLQGRYGALPTPGMLSE